MIKSLSIKNFKSIKDQHVEFNGINLLIGANGAGKSNLIDFFLMLRRIVDNDFQNYVAEKGFANNILHFGSKYSESLKAIVSVDSLKYKFELFPTEHSTLYFKEEKCEVLKNGEIDSSISSDSFFSDKKPGETRLYSMFHKSANNDFGDVYQIPLNSVIKELKNIKVYHFHDTGKNALLKSPRPQYDVQFFKPDGSNLAPFLFHLKKSYPKHFYRIEQTVKRIAPFIDRLHPSPDARNPEMIRLDWFEKGQEYPFYISSLSDGTIRMICLATLFFQPDLPEIIIIDEPELGLHPSAIYILGGLFKMAAAKGKQIIVSTQSVSLLDQFSPEEIIVVDRKSDTFDSTHSHSVYNRFDQEQLKDWLDEYSISEIWEKNLIGGMP